jgi:hypothetical protein
MKKKTIIVLAAPQQSRPSQLPSRTISRKGGRSIYASRSRILGSYENKLDIF